MQGGKKISLKKKLNEETGFSRTMIVPFLIFLQKICGRK